MGTTGKAGAMLGPHIGGSRAVVREDALRVASWWGGCEGASRGQVKAGQKGGKGSPASAPTPSRGCPFSLQVGKRALPQVRLQGFPLLSSLVLERPRKLRSRQHVVFRHCFSHILCGWEVSLTKGSLSVSVIAPGLPVHYPRPHPPGRLGSPGELTHCSNPSCWLPCPALTVKSSLHLFRFAAGGVLLTPSTQGRSHPFSGSSYKSIVFVSSLPCSVVAVWPPGSQCPALCSPTPDYAPSLTSKPW